MALKVDKNQEVLLTMKDLPKGMNKLLLKGLIRDLLKGSFRDVKIDVK